MCILLLMCNMSVFTSSRWSNFNLISEALRAPSSVPHSSAYPAALSCISWILLCPQRAGMELHSHFILLNVVHKTAVAFKNHLQPSKTRAEDNLLDFVVGYKIHILVLLDTQQWET